MKQHAAAAGTTKTDEAKFPRVEKRWINQMTRDQDEPVVALSDAERALIDAYWRAANYLSIGQIYLYDNPLLKQSLSKDHIKPRLLGHWGTTPGLNFIYVHLNRVINKHDLDMIYITGPGHGGPGLVANAYLEGSCSSCRTQQPQINSHWDG